ncbi:MAG: N-acetylmuramoyl-L-alanine amidase [Porticoccaceae bacterium]
MTVKLVANALPRTDLSFDIEYLSRARWFTPGPRTRGPIRFVVMHLTAVEAPLVNYLRYGARREDKVSCHYVACVEGIGQEVDEASIAYTNAGWNHATVTIEMDGPMSRSRAQWLGEFRPLVVNAARIAADVCRRHKLGIDRLSAAQMLDPRSTGIVDHLTCNQSMLLSGAKKGNPYTHVDVGHQFPWEEFLAMVHNFYHYGAEVAPPSRPDPTPVTPDDLTKMAEIDRYLLSIDFPGDLTPEMTGDAVKAVQWQITKTFKPIPVTGAMDPLTVWVLTEWQKARGFVVTGGVVNVFVWTALGCKPYSAPAIHPPPPPPAEVSPVTHPTLRLGSTGNYVVFLQHQLNKLIGTNLATDGNFGPQTRDAVVWFQTSRGLVADGVVGQQTWKAL